MRKWDVVARFYMDILAQLFDFNVHKGLCFFKKMKPILNKYISYFKNKS